MPPLALLLILFLALVRPVGAAAPVPGDFASGLDLPGAADGGAYSVALPLTVYEQLTREDMADLRSPLRAHSGDDAPVTAAIRAAIARKPKGHDFDYSRSRADGQMPRHMSHTGG